jgi:hypothetical protein
MVFPRTMAMREGVFPDVGVFIHER